MRVLRFKDLKPMKGIPWTRVHINRLEKAGKFPRRIRLGGNTVTYRVGNRYRMVVPTAPSEASEATLVSNRELVASPV